MAILTTHNDRDHKPNWQIQTTGKAVCRICGHVAIEFDCAKCGDAADESVIGHGAISAEGGGVPSHYPVKPANVWVVGKIVDNDEGHPCYSCGEVPRDLIQDVEIVLCSDCEGPFNEDDTYEGDPYER